MGTVSFVTYLPKYLLTQYKWNFRICVTQDVWLTRRGGIEFFLFGSSAEDWTLVYCPGSHSVEYLHFTTTRYIFVKVKGDCKLVFVE